MVFFRLSSGRKRRQEILKIAVYQEMELSVTGGCAKAPSDYKWFTSDMSILSVSAYGIIQAKRPEIATVKVVSTFDSHNFDEVIVEVSIPSSMVMLQNFPVETVVGSHLHAAVTMKALNGASFSKCDAFNSLIKWKTASESFVIDKEFHYFDKSLSESIDLNATLSIGAYLPLSVRQYSDGNHHGPVNKLDVIRAASQADRAPGRLCVTPVTVANGQIIRVAVVGISKFGEVYFSQVGTEQLQQFGILGDDDNSLRKHGLKSRFSFVNQKEMRCQSTESADKEGNPFSIECAVDFVVEILTQNLQELDQFMQDSSENESRFPKEVSPNDSHYLCIGTQSMEQLIYGYIFSWRISSKCENALDFGSRWLHLQILSCVCPRMLSRPDIIGCDRIKINANEVFTRNGSHEILLKQRLPHVHLQGQRHDIGTIEHRFMDLPDRFGTSIAILFGSLVIQKKKITVKDSTKQGEHVDDSDRLCIFIFGSLSRPPEARCVFFFQPSHVVVCLFQASSFLHRI